MGLLSWLTNLSMGGSPPVVSPNRRPIVIEAGQLQQLQSGNVLNLGPYQMPADIGGKLQYLTVPSEATILEWTDSSLYQASRDPLSSDGASDGFSKGSHWLNTDDNRLWICIDPTDGTSVWRSVYRREDDYLALCPTSGVGGTDNQSIQAGEGGNSRGTGAVDFQGERIDAQQVASGSRSVISGGGSNIASGAYSTVPGGSEGQANKFGQMAFASGSFSQPGDAQTSVFVMRISTTGNTPTEVRLDGGSERLTVPGGTAWAVRILAVASDSDAYCTAMWSIEGLVANNLGTTRYAGPGSTSPDQTLDYDGGSTDPTAWLIQPSADDTNDALAITVTGQTSVDIRWVVQVEATEVFVPTV